MSNPLGMTLVNLWKSGKYGTITGNAAVGQILADAHPDSIGDIMSTTPTNSIKQALRALQQAWDLFEQEAATFQRKGGVFQGAHLSAQDCFIISAMIPTMIPPGMGDAVFLANGNARHHQDGFTSMLKRKRQEREEQDGPDAKRQTPLGWPTGTGSTSNHFKRKREDDGEEEDGPDAKRQTLIGRPTDTESTSNHFKRKRQEDSQEQHSPDAKQRTLSRWPEPFAFVSQSPQLTPFTPWPEAGTSTSSTSPTTGIGRLSMNGPSQLASQKRKFENFRQMVIEADAQLCSKRLRLGDTRDQSAIQLAGPSARSGIANNSKSEPIDHENRPLKAERYLTPINFKQEADEDKAGEDVSLWDIPQFPRF